MRPNRLVIEAFGPYAERAEVDFDALADTRLFVVSGPTGAGKTSIFDAMCWALYGDLPGNRFREGRVRSDAAAPDRLTTVTFTFSVDDTTYRVTRRPEQERPKMRGTGTTTEKQQVELHRRVGGAWEPMSHRWAETNHTCAQLVGLSAAQFQQVVLLPQGRFQEVLHATSADRTELLRTLFDTAGFARAEDLLDQRAKAAEALRDGLEDEVGRSEVLAAAELDALEELVVNQGIELPSLKPTPPIQDRPETTSDDEHELAEPSTDERSERVKPQPARRSGRSAGPGQLSLVPEDVAAPEADATGSAATAAPEASSPNDATVPPAPQLSLGQRADQLKVHGVAPLEARRNDHRFARDTAETNLNRACQLADRQAQFQTDRKLLDERVRRLAKMEANRSRLDAAVRAAAVDGAHQASQRANHQLTQARSSADAALRQTADHLRSLVELWPSDESALDAASATPNRATSEWLPDWVSRATELHLTGIPETGGPQLAEALELLAQRSDRAAADLRNRANEMTAARDLARQASARRAEADAALKRTEQLDAELSELATQQGKLDTDRETAATLTAGADRARAALTEATELRDARVAFDLEQDELVELEAELAAVAQRARTLADNVGRLSTERDTLRRRADAVADHRSDAERAAEALRLAQRRDQAESELVDATAEARRCGSAYNDLMAAFTDDAAPSLAASLVDGDDCPVCGSTEHPRPAVAPEGSEPASSANLEHAHQANLTAIGRRSAIQDRLDDCRSKLGDAATEPASVLVERSHGAQKLVDEAVAAANRAMEIDRQLTGLEQQRHVLEQHDRSAHVRQASAQQRLTTLEQRLGESFDVGLTDLNARVAAANAEAHRCDAAVATVAGLDRQRSELAQRVEKLTKRRTEASGQQLAACTQADHLDSQAAMQLSKPDTDWPHTRLAQDCENLGTSARRAATSLDALYSSELTADDAGSALQAALERQGFDDVEAVKAAFLATGEQRSMEAVISRWEGEGFALTERLVTTVEGGLGLVSPNLDELRTRLSEATDLANLLTEHTTTARNHLGRARRAIAGLDGRGEERAAAQANFETTHRLARMCRGYNPGRVTLEAWVLAHHLREVVIAANRRLGAMSRGRFQIHVDDEAADQRAKHGLDLSIADAETGTRRPVRTLSGGQTFQASLALALGLADTIAVQRVGRDIGATFIDEGFGGLDSDSLDTAIEVLANLGAEGQMIGVITHVEELKAVLPVAIEVTPIGGGRSELTQLIGDMPAGGSTTAGSSAEVA